MKKIILIFLACVLFDSCENPQKEKQKKKADSKTVGSQKSWIRQKLDSKTLDSKNFDMKEA